MTIHAAAMRFAYHSGITTLVGRLLPGHGCLLAFHRVAASNEWSKLPNRDFYIDTEFLGHLLDYLSETGWSIVTMDEAVSRLRDGDRSRFVNFSIDDVYRDTVEAALPVFRNRNAPVTLYVTTGIPDGTMLLWQAGLETIIQEGKTIELENGTTVTVDSDIKKRKLFSRLCFMWEQHQPEKRYERFCEQNGYSADALNERNAVTWSMLEMLRDDPCVEIGGHTMNHPHLSWLSEQTARDETLGCRTRLQERLKRRVDHFAFPFGRRTDCGQREFTMAREAGFVSAVTTRRGLVEPGDDQRLHSLPRNIINGGHRATAQIETHLSGLGGLVARVRGAT